MTALNKRFAELVELLGVSELTRPEITEDELTAIAVRIDAAVTGITGISARDRALVWLHDAVREVGQAMSGDFETSGAEINVPLQLYARFCLGQSERFPWFTGGKEKVISTGERVRVQEVRVVGRALVAAARASLRPGRRRSGTRPIPKKWEALRDFAVAEGLIGAMQSDEFRRTVLAARAKLSRVERRLRKE